MGEARKALDGDTTATRRIQASKGGEPASNAQSSVCDILTIFKGFVAKIRRDGEGGGGGA